jgi:hypothetical protein
MSHPRGSASAWFCLPAAPAALKKMHTSAPPRAPLSPPPRARRRRRSRLLLLRWPRTNPRRPLSLPRSPSSPSLPPHCCRHPPLALIAAAVPAPDTALDLASLPSPYPLAHCLLCISSRARRRRPAAPPPKARTFLPQTRGQHSLPVIADLACSSWRATARGPLTWRRVELRDWATLTSGRRAMGPGPSCTRVPVHAALAGILDVAAMLAEGRIEAVLLPEFADEDHLLFLCSSLYRKI